MGLCDAGVSRCSASCHDCKAVHAHTYTYTLCASRNAAEMHTLEFLTLHNLHQHWHTEVNQPKPCMIATVRTVEPSQHV